MTKKNVERFISIIRDSFIGSQEVYTQGSCYHFYLILKEVFPTAIAYYDRNHIVSKIDDKFYDITGEVEFSTKSLQFLYKFDNLPSYSLKMPYNIYKKK